MDNILKYKPVLIAVSVILLSLIGLFIYDHGRQNGFRVMERVDYEQQQVFFSKIHIEGAVKSPGVYLLTSNMRGYEAIVVAGGFLPNASLGKINLARQIQDGEKLLISFDRTLSPKTTTKVPKDKALAVININQATLSELQTLPGIGETYAKSMIAYRSANGGFRQLSDVLNVKGIGPKKLSKMRPFISIN